MDETLGVEKKKNRNTTRTPPPPPTHVLINRARIEKVHSFE